MALRLYNVRTRQKEAFEPLDPQRVGMYVCGLTVYDHMHIGHARTAVSFEVIRRWLERSWPLRYVQNVTDVDDKIIARAAELGVSPREHAATWDAECVRQSERLGVRSPDETPHATTSMPGIIAFVQGILQRGFAYATDQGNVYFDVPRYDDHAAHDFPGAGYGSLSGRDYRDMAAGTRKEVEEDKRHPADFALWKAAKPGEPGDATWDSPWGRGRPGWHIECSEMSTAALGPQIDIHGGGQDLIFPHHENEVAQSQARTGVAPFVRYWMHTGFLNVEGQKMSKSLGNYITLSDMLDELEAAGRDPAVLRLYFVMAHYRTRIDFSRQGLEEAANGLERLERVRHALVAAAGKDADHAQDAGQAGSPGDTSLQEAAAMLDQEFTAAMDDDVHTPGAVAALFTFARTANAALSSGVSPTAATAALGILERCGRHLTLFDKPPQEPPTAPGSVLALLAAREEARKVRDWSRADALRDEIRQAGYVIEDTSQGPRLVPA